MHNLNHQFSDRVTEIFAQSNRPQKIAVAVSGGCDSLALTFLLHAFCQERGIELSAVTVNHQMRQASQAEAIKVGKLLQSHNIQHTILQISQQQIPQSNIEAKLREARYDLLHRFCVTQKIDFLFLGHIQGDIAENFMIRLFRGSGLDGLSSIAPVSRLGEITLVRPLLDITKEALKSFLRDSNIQWFEDETNQDEKFLRNKIRHFFDTFEDKNLIQKRIKNATDEIATMRDLFDDLMLQQAAEILTLHHHCFIVLDVQKFAKIDQKIALKILALILMEIGEKPYKPRLEKLKRFYGWVIQTQHQKARNFYGCIAKPFDASSIAIYNEANPEKKIVRFNTVLNRIFKSLG